MKAVLWNENHPAWPSLWEALENALVDCECWKLGRALKNDGRKLADVARRLDVTTGYLSQCGWTAGTKSPVRTFACEFIDPLPALRLSLRHVVQIKHRFPDSLLLDFYANRVHLLLPGRRYFI